MADKKNSDKQRRRKILADLNFFYPHHAIVARGVEIGRVAEANESDDPDAQKLLDQLLKVLQAAKKPIKIEAEKPDMPADYGSEKTDEELAVEERIEKLSGQLNEAATAPAATTTKSKATIGPK